MDTSIKYLYKILRLVFGKWRLEEKPGFKLLQQLVLKLARKESVQVNGYTLFLDTQDSLKLSMHGYYEPDETALIKQTLKPGQIAVDIGANIGYYTMLFSNLVGDKGHVYAFEPATENLKILRKNVTVNKTSNITVVPKAVSDRPTKRELYLSSSNFGAHSVVNAQENQLSITVDCVSLDSFFGNNIPKVALLKIDIQGAEYQVLNGMQKFLKLQSDIIVATEFWPYGLTQANVKPVDYLNLLTKLGFNVLQIDRQTHKLHQVVKENLLIELTPENRRFTDLWCVRGKPINH